MSRPSLRQDAVELSDFDRLLLRSLQSDFPLASSPYEILSKRLGVPARDILDGVCSLLERGVITRFGPLLNIERAGGAFSLCALKVPDGRFDDVTETVNAYQQVAHNYRRDHDWNMWFVLACETRDELDRTFAEIESRTACPGMNLPKEREFFVGLKFDV